MKTKEPTLFQCLVIAPVTVIIIFMVLAWIKLAIFGDPEYDACMAKHNDAEYCNIVAD